jgi:hypothetical protein
MVESIFAIVIQILPMLLKFANKALDDSLKQKAIDQESYNLYKEHISAAQASIGSLGDDYMANKKAKQQGKEEARKRRIEAETAKK